LKLGAVQVSLHRKFQIDPSLRVLQQSHRQIQRQIHGFRRVHPVAKHDSIDDDLVRRIQLSFLDPVLQIETKLPALDLSSRELG